MESSAVELIFTLLTSYSMSGCAVLAVTVHVVHSTRWRGGCVGLAETSNLILPPI